MFKWLKPSPPKPVPSVERTPRPREAPNLQALRTPLSEADKVVSALGAQWLQQLPPETVPQALARQFPRIVNRFALVWPDAVLTESYFDSLMIDSRGGRKGFPPEVMDELIQLRLVHGRRQRVETAPARMAGGLAMKPIDFDQQSTD